MSAGVIALGAAILAMGVLSAWLAGRLARAAGVADAPDGGHKAHLRPVPTLGGLAMALGFGLSLSGLLLLQGFTEGWRLPPGALRDLVGVVGLCAGLLALGLLDDLFDLPAKFKAAMIAALGLAFASLFATVDRLPLTSEIGLQLNGFGAIVGTALWIFVLSNTVNFIDGSDGLAAGATGVGLVGLAVVAGMAGSAAALMLALAGVSACLGFLALNRPPASLYAGDAGALFLGGLAAGAAILAVKDGAAPYAVALCFLPMLADVLLTLFFRWRKRRALLSGHREHHYQIARRAGVSAGMVAAGYAALAAHCALCAAAGSLFGPAGALVALIGNSLVLVYVSIKTRAYAAGVGLDTPV
jgi:UDP-GlcNAc:undecaprenyl-phosphate GlcNAc-1-phosphate transferase